MLQPEVDDGTAHQWEHLGTYAFAGYLADILKAGQGGVLPSC